MRVTSKATVTRMKIPRKILRAFFLFESTIPNVSDDENAFSIIPYFQGFEQWLCIPHKATVTRQRDPTFLRVRSSYPVLQPFIQLPHRLIVQVQNLCGLFFRHGSQLVPVEGDPPAQGGCLRGGKDFSEMRGVKGIGPGFESGSAFSV